MQPHPSNCDSSARWSRDLLVLALVFGGLNLFLLGRLPLANPDEGRYAEIPREMIGHHDWVTPRLNDIPYFEKPPLVYWTVGMSRLLLGPGETSVRLTPALFGLAGVLLTYAAARRLFGRAAGIGSAVVLGTSGLYLVLSRILLLDMAVSVLISGTLFCFILAMREPPGPRRRWLCYGLYASAALATLAKGLIGFLIPGAVMFLWVLVMNHWRRLLPLYLPTGILVFLVIAGPWHVLAAQRNPEWARFYFVHEHWERFTTTAHDRAAPFWFFIPVVLLGLFPWIGFLPTALRDSVKGNWRSRKDNPEAWFFAIWAAFIFLFFSKSQSKLIPYILPIFPALAVVIGAWASRQWSSNTLAPLRTGLRVFAFICGLLGMATLVVALRPNLIRDAEQAAALKPFALILALTFLVGGVAAPWAAKVRGVFAGTMTMAGTMVSVFLVLILAAPGLQRAGTKELALIARERIPAKDRIYHYWAFFHDFVYYSERPVGLISYVDELEVQFLSPAEKAERFIDDAELKRKWNEPARLWVVVRKRDQVAAKSVFTDPAFRYHLIAETRAHSLISNQP